ncbi:Plant protein of unknown function (DUF828) with plant pleckstrin homology-like region [Striga hermonthica]|uniref:VAN3-binding protein-like auxin canalisation domain-containing protein n=1 Tax=Striga hermonthica TaxID=68872 RepID=A0A9N7RTN6_STRHE|nr:Plant protein of unknown function (DUF828) with plant pleckstrin homology-like region [Striga hermonthica]
MSKPADGDAIERRVGPLFNRSSESTQSRTGQNLGRSKEFVSCGRGHVVEITVQGVTSCGFTVLDLIAPSKKVLNSCLLLVQWVPCVLASGVLQYVLIAFVVSSAGDIMTFMATNATTLRYAATVKARALKDVWNLAVVIPVDKGMGVANGGSNGSLNGCFSGELVPEENFLAICSRELLARSCELLEKMRQGVVWKDH